MNSTEETKQWNLCPFCGAQKIHGEYAKQVIEKMVGGGKTKEEAEGYVNSSKAYLECPSVDSHTEVVLPLEQLENGAYYHGSCRNATFARWNGDTKRFVYMREKFGNVYPEEIGYWIEVKPGEHRFDEFKPYGKMDEMLFEIPLNAR